jgi:hypothetical protein
MKDFDWFDYRQTEQHPFGFDTPFWHHGPLNNPLNNPFAIAAEDVQLIVQVFRKGKIVYSALASWEDHEASGVVADGGFIVSDPDAIGGYRQADLPLASSARSAIIRSGRMFEWIDGTQPSLPYEAGNVPLDFEKAEDWLRSNKYAGFRDQPDSVAAESQLTASLFAVRLVPDGGQRRFAFACLAHKAAGFQCLGERNTDGIWQPGISHNFSMDTDGQLHWFLELELDHTRPDYDEHDPEDNGDYYGTAADGVDYGSCTCDGDAIRTYISLNFVTPIGGALDGQDIPTFQEHQLEDVLFSYTCQFECGGHEAPDLLLNRLVWQTPNSELCLHSEAQPERISLL